MRKHIKVKINTKEIEALVQDGKIDSLYEIGHRYEFAASIDKIQKSLNQQQAMAYYFAAAAKGHPEAALRYGLGCERGYIGRKQQEMAFQYYQRAITLKNIRAHFEIARCYEKGIGTQPDNMNALKYYQQTVTLVQTVINKFRHNKLNIRDPHAPDLNEMNKIFSLAKEKVDEIQKKIKLLPK
jgi:tetratricopeptide (TPR) repeat protein